MTLPHTSRSITSSFIAEPKGVYFEAQRENEHLYLLMRQHQITNVPWLLIAFVLLLVPLLIYSTVSVLFPEFVASNSFFLQLALVYAWFLFVAIYAFQQLLRWFFNVYIITNDRLIDIDFPALFSKEVSEARVTRIQDVSSDVHGALQIMFNYGLVSVQTAAEELNIEFENVPNPDQVSKLIGELVHERGGTVGVHDKG